MLGHTLAVAVNLRLPKLVYITVVAEYLESGTKNFFFLLGSLACGTLHKYILFVDLCVCRNIEARKWDTQLRRERLDSSSGPIQKCSRRNFALLYNVMLRGTHGKKVMIRSLSNLPRCRRSFDSLGVQDEIYSRLIIFVDLNCVSLSEWWTIKRTVVQQTEIIHTAADPSPRGQHCKIPNVFLIEIITFTYPNLILFLSCSFFFFFF